MTQLALFRESASIRERFERFHAEHPEVYAKLAELALEARRKGFAHYGIRSLWERMRWHFQIERGDEDFKLNDHYPAHYARLLMQEYPELQGFFETREIRAE